MNIAIDSHYYIGRAHLVCQDYACHGDKPLPYIILADGCSASPDTDIGARLLALNARRLIRRFCPAAEKAPAHWELGRQIVARSARQARRLGLARVALDATLMIALLDRYRVRVHLYGDGCILARRRDGGVEVTQVDYSGNAPYYLSYWEDPPRRESYWAALSDPGQAQRIYRDGAAHFRNPDTPAVFDFAIADYPVLAVATDGLGSFIKAGTGERLELLRVAEELTAFKDVNGAFVKRRLRRALAVYGRRDIHNADDIGLGAFVQV